MLYHLKFLSELWGPFRMMGSHLLLISFAAIAAAILCCRFLPRLARRLPCDRGKAFVKDGALSKGKPTGIGYYMVLLSLPVLILVLPFFPANTDEAATFGELLSRLGTLASDPSQWHLLLNRQWGIVFCLFASMMTGYLDDKSIVPWGPIKKGLLDLVICFSAALILCRFHAVDIWLPFVKSTVTLSWPLYTILATLILWVSMNATNCTDGVDGLAGSLTLISLFGSAAFLYGIVGHEQIAQYLLIPHNPEGARWAILCSAYGGVTAGYLWHNAHPSSMLMGDAGSRPLGLLAGVAALVSGNPFVILVMFPVVILDGFTGVLKMAFLKVMNAFHVNTGSQNGDNSNVHWIFRVVRSIRCPLHDHLKVKYNWSPGQILLRFVLIQAGLMPLLFFLLVKIR